MIVDFFITILFSFVLFLFECSPNISGVWTRRELNADLFRAREVFYRWTTGPYYLPVVLVFKFIDLNFFSKSSKRIVD